MTESDVKRTVAAGTPILATSAGILGSSLAAKLYERRHRPMFEKFIEDYAKKYNVDYKYVNDKTWWNADKLKVIKGKKGSAWPALNTIQANTPMTAAHELGHLRTHKNIKPKFIKNFIGEFKASKEGYNILKKVLGKKFALKAIPVYTSYYSTYASPILLAAAGIYGIKKVDNMDKKAGILDEVRDQLAIDVWNERMVLRPELRQNIIDAIKAVTPLSNVEGAWIIGSITGYKYTESSDIDINVSVYEFSPALREKAKKASGILTHSGRHPVNLFIKETSGKRPTWQDAFFGVYDVINNDWINLPPKREIYRDPNVEFKLEILYARKIAQDFNDRVEKLKELLGSLHRYKRMAWSIPTLARPELNRRRALVKLHVKKLIEMAHALEDERKFAYRWGWGIPRKDFRNIVYKVIEHGPYGKLFLLLEKVPLEEEFGSEDMLKKEANNADKLLEQAVKRYKKGKSDIVPTFGEYQALKMQERASVISKPNRPSIMAGGGLGAAIGLLATKKKAPWRIAARNVASGTLLGATLGHGVSSRAKVLAAKNMLRSDKDVRSYNEILRRHLSTN